MGRRVHNFRLRAEGVKIAPEMGKTRREGRQVNRILIIAILFALDATNKVLFPSRFVYHGTINRLHYLLVH